MEPAYKKNFMPNLFSWTELEDLINRGTHLSEGFYRYSHDELSKEIKWQICPWTNIESEMPVSKLKEFIDTLSVFYFMDCSRVKKIFNDFCAELEELEQRPFDTHIFVHYKNLKRPHPFGCHFDLSLIHI